jgi:predicted Fe-S protein YdhL (DUF1289 family)
MSTEPLSRDVLAKLRERFEGGQRALDPAIALRLIAQVERAVPAPNVAAYQFLCPIRRAAGYCTAKCDYDVNGVCRNCDCLDPERFVVMEYPTKEQDEALRLATRVQESGASLSVISLAAAPPGEPTEGETP